MHIGITAIGPNLGTDEEVPSSLKVDLKKSIVNVKDGQEHPLGESGVERRHVDVDGRGREGILRPLSHESSELRSHGCLEINSIALLKSQQTFQQTIQQSF